MKMNAKGLVSVRFAQNYNIYKAGSLAGFEPKVANQLISAGIATDPDAKAAPAEDAPEKMLLVATADSTVQIPASWRDAHHMARINWAKAIAPDATEVTADKANKIIAEAVKDQE